MVTFSIILMAIGILGLVWILIYIIVEGGAKEEVHYVHIPRYLNEEEHALSVIRCEKILMLVRVKHIKIRGSKV